MKKASALIITFVFTFFCLSAPARQILDIFNTTQANAAVWDGQAAAGFERGTGTISDPYIIKTPQQLKYFADRVNNGQNYYGKYIRLVEDIQMNDTTGWESWATTPPANAWTPISRDGTFSGTFDGGNHTITGIYINASSSFVGFFGQVFSATIKNVDVSESFICSSGNFTGGIVGFAYNSTIENCRNSANVRGLFWTGYSW